MSDQVPEHGLQLRTLVTASQTVELSLADVDVAAPEPNQVVIRIEAAPINPSDRRPVMSRLRNQFLWPLRRRLQLK